MKKEEIEKFLEKARKELRTFGIRAKDLAVYGTGFGKLKIEVRGLESKRDKILKQIGEKTLKLIRANKITDKEISKLSSQVEKINKEIKKKKTASSILQKKLSKTVKK